jgi:hypothetical protein
VSSTATRATPIKSNICAVWLSTRAGFRPRQKISRAKGGAFSGATLQKNFSRSPVQVKAVQLGRIAA